MPQDLILAKGPAGVLLGARAVIDGIRQLFKDSKLRKLALIPLLLTLVVYSGLLVAGFVYVDDLLALIWAKPQSWWMVTLWYLTWFSSVIAMLLVMAMLFSTIVEAIGGPFYDQMAMHILATQGLESKDPGLIAGTLPDLWRSIVLLTLTLIATLIGLIPIIGLPFALLGTLLAWFSFGVASLNPTLLVSGYSLGERMRAARGSLGVTLGIGATVAVSLLVPLLGIVSIPGAVVGASELCAQKLKQNANATS